MESLGGIDNNCTLCGYVIKNRNSLVDWNFQLHDKGFNLSDDTSIQALYSLCNKVINMLCVRRKALIQLIP